MTKFNITPPPRELKEHKGFLTGKPFFLEATGESVLYQTIKFELGTTGTIPVNFALGKGDEYSSSDEGYVLEINKDGIFIYADDARGHFYGTITLISITEQFGEKLPFVTIKDKPVTEFRSGAFETGHGMICRLDWFKRFTRKLAFLKANHIYFSAGWLAFTSLPEIAPYYPDALNEEEARELAEYAKSYNVIIIPPSSIQGHADEVLSLEKFRELREVMEGEETSLGSIGNSFCPNNPKAQLFCRDMIDKLVDIFKPDIMHVGLDEIYSCGGDKACLGAKQAIGKTGIILSNAIHFRDYLEAKGVKLGIWGDMIVSLSGENRYDGNIEDSKYKASNEYLLKELRRNTVIFDWWYVGASEVSQQFFADHGFDVVACTSTHACMMHFASPQQQINMWKLFRGAQKRNFYGGMITDWINMYGYHCEQTLFNQAAGCSMLWKGTDDNFIDGVTREAFETAFMAQEYGKGAKAMREYMHLAGDLYGDLLSIFSVKNKGVALRKVFFYHDNPLLFRLKFGIDLENGGFEKYKAQVKKLKTLWAEIEKTVDDYGYLEALHMPALLHEYLSTEYEVIDKVAKLYNEAAYAQFDNKKVFKAKLQECADTVRTLTGKTDALYGFVIWVKEKLGNNDLSDLRIKGREQNIQKLARYFEYLQNDKRLLPQLKIVSDTLFRAPQTHWWAEHIFEASEQEGEFSTYDVDLCQIYESMDWEFPLNK